MGSDSYGCIISPYDNADSVYIAHLNGNIGSGIEYVYYTNNSYGNYSPDAVENDDVCIVRPYGEAGDGCLYGVISSYGFMCINDIVDHQKILTSLSVQLRL